MPLLDVPVPSESTPPVLLRRGRRRVACEQSDKYGTVILDRKAQLPRGGSRVPDLAALARPDYRPEKGPACTIGLAFRSLSEADAANLTAALENPHAPSSAIARALSSLGHDAKPYTVQRHRRRECRCPE
jgi:hypothetical protein